MDIDRIIGRQRPLFETDLAQQQQQMDEMVSDSRFLVIGAGGSIGAAVCHEIFKRGAKALHCVDLSENGLVELVRDLRSSHGYATESFDTFALDFGSREFERFFADTDYDYVLNLAALKHVRSENSVHTMARMVEVNLINTLAVHRLSEAVGVKKYFCVSTDKAANPTNFMGATKRAMELCLMQGGNKTSVSSARFANVAFSNGSLLHGFKNRLGKRQPISIPSDISRYFISEREAAQLCMVSTLFCGNNKILFPKDEDEIRLIRFRDILERFLDDCGMTPAYCASEQEARDFDMESVKVAGWPVYAFETDTTGEKLYEEFFTDSEKTDLETFRDFGMVEFVSKKSDGDIQDFLGQVDQLMEARQRSREDFLRLFQDFVPTFAHSNTGKFLNQRM